MYDSFSLTENKIQQVIDCHKILLEARFLMILKKHVLELLLGVQISSVRFPKDGSSCYEWFIVITVFGGFREVKYLLIIFSLYRFEFHTKMIDFYCV